MPFDIDKPIALVGLMGVGKTTVGRRLAKKLGYQFLDSDDEIEKASGRTVAGYFRDHGEAEFREGEYRVINRILDDNRLIIGTGGGAFIHPKTHKILLEKSITVWLKGDFDTLFERVRRKDTRPLLQVPDPEGTYRKLMDERYPIYAQADITVNIAKGAHGRTVNRVQRAIEFFLSEQSDEPTKKRHRRRHPSQRRRKATQKNKSSQQQKEKT
ncbi:MAG: shikimate kinase [Maricaulaceae bacterium]